jgi:hypothetical protein
MNEVEKGSNGAMVGATKAGDWSGRMGLNAAACHP